MLPSFCKHDRPGHRTYIERTYDVQTSSERLMYVNLCLVSRGGEHVWAWLLSNSCHILLKIWMVGRLFYAPFAFEKWRNMSFVKFVFFWHTLFWEPKLWCDENRYSTLLIDLKYPLISKENMCFINQVGRTIHFCFLKYVTFRILQTAYFNIRSRNHIAIERKTIYNPPFTNFLTV